MKKDNIKVNGFTGRWYVINEFRRNGKKYYVLEHETYGDMTSHIIIDNNYNYIEEETNQDLYNDYCY